jgi:pimeloyl-ACP methyl ester carboxylesterase
MADSILLENAQLITVDRPGFGASNFGYAEPSLERQAAVLRPLIEENKKGRPVILVGHSLGGPVIARMAMDYPELINGLIFVAASVDPDLEPNEWFRGPLATPFLKWILPRSLRASNDEIYQLKPELQRMLPLWQEVTSPAIIIQGNKDTLVPPGNAEFIKRMMAHAEVKVVMEESMNHFVPWTHPHLIRQAILDFTKSSASAHLTGQP